MAEMLNNRFRMIQSTSRSLYGCVWLCEDTQQDHLLVAIKEVSLLSAELVRSTNANADDPVEERRIVRRLSETRVHTSVLRLLGEFCENGSWFVVMEYCDGGDLMRRVEDAPMNRLGEDVALRYFRQIVQGVHFLHDIGIAHRDLSLENVLLRDDICKVCDFGLATAANRSCIERVGKAFYMAPEVVAQQEYDPTLADMWSLGIMIFMMLTGSPLVPSASREEKAFLAVEQFGVAKILDVWGMSSSISPAAMDLLVNLLQVSPAKRLRAIDVLEHEVFRRP